MLAVHGPILALTQNIEDSERGYEVTPEQMHELAKLIAEHGLPPSWEQWGLLIALQFIVLVASAYIGAHFGKRGEIDAINGKLDKVVEQQKILTSATATIHSNISRRDWLDQRKWEVKQKFYWDLLTTVQNIWRAYLLSAAFQEYGGKQSDKKARSMRTKRPLSIWSRPQDLPTS